RGPADPNVPPRSVGVEPSLNHEITGPGRRQTGDGRRNTPLGLFSSFYRLSSPVSRLLMIWSISSHVTARTPSPPAFSSFEPAFSPASRKSVLRERDPETLAPAASRRSVASSRVIPGSVPVKTTVLPESAPGRGWRGACDWKLTPRLRRLSISSLW